MAPGTVTQLWENFCVATFTSDYPLFDPTLDPTFSPRAGERYLITSFGVGSATLGYLTSGAFIRFSVGANPDGSLPFTSNCAPEPPLSYVAVFANVRVFSDAQLTQTLCDLEVGAAMLYDESKPFGSSLQSQGPAGYVYEVSLNAFAARCGGASEGYILVQPLTELGATRILVPIAMLEAEQMSD